MRYSFSHLEQVCCSMSSSNCCFLTCIKVSQEAGQVVWYLMKVKKESENVGLKFNIQKTKSWHLVPSFHWKYTGKQWKQCQTLFLVAPKWLQMVIAVMKLKDAYCLEGKLFLRHFFLFQPRNDACYRLSFTFPTWVFKKYHRFKSRWTWNLFCFFPF